MQLNKDMVERLAGWQVDFQPETLLFVHQRKWAIVADCVRSGQFGSPPEPPTSHNFDQILELTGWANLRVGRTFLNEPPVEWLTCSEPQITGGWAHFLAAENRLMRCQAMFDAVVSLVGATPVRLDHVDAVRAEDGRVDLLVAATSQDEQVNIICIEAKFGHAVTEGQLNKSAKFAQQQFNPSGLTCLVIGPKLNPNVITMSREARPVWAFSSWKRFLIAYENALPLEADSTGFRQFRSTCLARNQWELS